MKTRVWQKKRLIFLQHGFVSWQGVSEGSLARKRAGEIRAGQACVLWYKCCLYPWQLHHGLNTWLPDRAVVLDKNLHWFSTFFSLNRSLCVDRWERKFGIMAAVISGFVRFIGSITFDWRWTQIIALYREHHNASLTLGLHCSPLFKGPKNDLGLFGVCPALSSFLFLRVCISQLVQMMLCLGK